MLHVLFIAPHYFLSNMYSVVYFYNYTAAVTFPIVIVSFTLLVTLPTG